VLSVLALSVTCLLLWLYKVPGNISWWYHSH